MKLGRLEVVLLLAVLGGCVDKTPFAVVKNTCLTNTECADAGAVCDLTLQQCIREKVDESYQVILQVRAKESDLALESGETLVSQATFRPFTLTEAVTDKVLEVPLSEHVTGKVVRTLEDGGLQAVEAELTFTPQDKTIPVSTPTVINTRSMESGGTLDNLSANLNPGMEYKVRAQPLLSDSKTLAPFSTTYSSIADGTSGVPFVFDKMDRRGGQLHGENNNEPLVGYRIRLEDKVSGAILSSTDTTEAGGAFELYAPKEVMEGQSFYVVVSMEPFPLWSMKVKIDGSRLVPNVVLTIPSAPAPVVYEGSVEEEMPDDRRGPPVRYANVVFSSLFPLSEESDDTRVFWCRWRGAVNAPPPLCSAQVNTSTDASGRFSVPLLPGDYDVFISPSSETDTRAVLSTTKGGAAVRTQPGGGAHAGPRFPLPRAIHYEGFVTSLGLVPMPNVVVTARPLSFAGSDEAIYNYARPASALTERRGTFGLDVDLGYFDLIVEPPEESGFAWVHSLNRVVRKKPDKPVGPLQPSPPVPVSGYVRHEDAPLVGAVVEAFALITEGPAGQRAVRIAQTVTDDAGAYRLALPPAVRALDPEDAGADGGAGGGEDGGARADGGMDASEPDAGYSE